MDEEKQIITYEDMKNFSLEHEDFSGKFKALKTSMPNIQNLPTIMHMADSMAENLTSELKNSFVLCRKSEEEFFAEWERIDAFTSSDLIGGLKLKFEAVLNTNERLQVLTSQALAYLGLCYTKLGDELYKSYSGKIEINEDSYKLVNLYNQLQQGLKELEPMIKQIERVKKERE